MRSVVEKTDRIVSGESTKLPDGIDESEAGGRRCVAQHRRGYRPESGEVSKQEPAPEEQEHNRQSHFVPSKAREEEHQTRCQQRDPRMPIAFVRFVGVPTVDEHSQNPQQRWNQQQRGHRLVGKS